MAYNTVTARSGPPESFQAVTPSDTTLLSGCQFLYVGGTGTLVLKGFNDAGPTTLTAVPAGEFVPFGAGYVMAASTTTGIVALS